MARRKTILQDVLVVDIADKGHAIGKTPDGEVVIIYKDAVPGDRIDLSVARKKKGLRHGFVHRIIDHSKFRTEARCKHFGTCGGCKWQELTYAKQTELKENQVRQLIRRLAKDDERKVEKIKGATHTYEYRNKLEFTFSTKRWLTNQEISSGTEFENRSGLGFHIAGAFDKVLDIEHCLLQPNLQNRIRNSLRDLAIERQWSFYDIKENAGFLRNLLIRNSTMGQWMVTIVFGEDEEEKRKEVFQNLVEQFPEVISWSYLINTKRNSSYADLDVHHYAGPTHIEERLGNIKYLISPKSFFQTNSHQAKVLYDSAVEMLELTKDDIVYDLYTGTGSIALYVAGQCKSAVGIEVIPEAIRDARLNAKMNEVQNVHFITGDVRDVLDPSFEQKYGKANVVITDPPRAGMHEEVISTLLALEPDKILYISCNPGTQARDILFLKEKFELQRVVPVDMFPHTSHTESIALLTLRN